MSADQTILLQCPIDGSVFLEVLKGVGRPAKRVGHVESKKKKKSRRGINACYKGSVREFVQEELSCGNWSSCSDDQKPRLAR
jgi:hypothetical protein